MMKLIFPIILIAIIITVAAFFLLNKQGIGIVGDVHRHADFKVYINDVPINFTQEKYMSFANHTLSNFIHLHDMDGDVIHQHISGIKLKPFFESLGIQFTNDCFAIDGQNYCNNEQSSLKFFVNGQQNSQFENYELQDLDKILISYGPKNQDINFQIMSFTYKTCIHS